VPRQAFGRSGLIFHLVPPSVKFAQKNINVTKIKLGIKISSE
jgi:hypothetical protein